MNVQGKLSTANSRATASLLAYFKDNWDACKEMWVQFKRDNLPHFRNNTNNRLESQFGKLYK